MFYAPVWTYREYTLVTRPDTPYYHITWTPPGSRKLHRKSTKTTSLELAKERLIALADLLSRPPGSNVAEPHAVMIEEVIAYYLGRHLKTDHPSRRTTEDNLRPLRAFMAEYGLTLVSDLDPDTLDLFPEFRNRLYRNNQLRRLRNTGKYAGWSEHDLAPRIRNISSGTIGRELSVLNAALRFFRKRNRITHVPFIQLPPAAPARSRWLTPDEFGRLHAAAGSQHLKDFMLLAIYTLQRPGFLLDLRVDQVDLHRRRIEFLRPGMRQTKKGRPSIRIADQLLPVLERLIASSVSGNVLEYEGRPIGCIRKSFAAAVIAANLHDPEDPHSQPVVPYTLRHSGSTWLAQAGVDLWQISGMLGHRDTRMVERVYAKHHPDFQRGAAETLDRLVSDSVNRAKCAPNEDNVLPWRHAA